MGEDFDWNALVRDVRLRETRAVNGFVSALKGVDGVQVIDAWQAVQNTGCYVRALRAACRVTVSPAAREAVLSMWLHDGDGIRSDVTDDLVLIKALRAMLPPYEGPALRLYRGDSAFNRSRRTYGMSWSADRTTAENFARFAAHNYSGGGVLLEIDAPAEAIICTPPPDSDPYEEQEFILDRRRLRGVRVLERFPYRGPSTVSR